MSDHIPDTTFPTIAIDQCPVCGHELGDEVPIGTAALRRCGECSLIYAPEIGAPDQVYTDEYLTSASSFGPDTNDPLIRAIGMAAAARRFGMLEKLVEPGTMLDVGCGSGEALEVATDRGWDPIGLDPVPESVDRARERGLTAHVGTLDRHLELRNFDAVHASHVLEHVHRPVDFLTELASRCRTGGFIILEVPNWDNSTREEKGELWEQLCPLEHLSHFTPATLHATMRRAGLTPTTATVTVTADTPEIDGAGRGFAIVGISQVTSTTSGDRSDTA